MQVDGQARMRKVRAADRLVDWWGKPRHIEAHSGEARVIQDDWIGAVSTPEGVVFDPDATWAHGEFSQFWHVKLFSKIGQKAFCVSQSHWARFAPDMQEDVLLNDRGHSCLCRNI